MQQHQNYWETRSFYAQQRLENKSSWTKTTDGQWGRWRINNTAAGSTGGYLLLSLDFIKVASEEAAQPLNVTAFFNDTPPLFLSAHWSRLLDSHGSKGPVLNATPRPQKCLVSPIWPQDLFQLVAERRFTFLFVKRQHRAMTAVQQKKKSPPFVLEKTHRW